MTIRAKVVALTAGLVFVSLCIAGGFFFASYYNALLNATYETLNTSVTQVQTAVSGNLEAVNNVAYYVFSSEHIRNWLNNDLEFPPEDPLSFSKISKLKKDIQMMLIFNNSWIAKHIDTIYIFADGQTIDLISRSSQSLPEQLAAFEQIKTRAEAVPDSTMFFPPDESGQEVYFVKRIHNTSDTKELLLILSVNQAAFSEELRQFPAGVTASVVDNDGVVFFSNTAGLLGQRSVWELSERVPVKGIPHAYELKSPGGDQFLVYRTMRDKGLNIMISQPKAGIVAQTMASMNSYLWVMAATLVVLIVLSLAVAAAYTRFLGDIIGSLNRVRGKDYTARMPRYKDRQLNMISDTFNHMTDEIETLINRVYRSNLLLRENDIKLLQSQMNPHFLVNTLTTIGTSALMRGERGTYEAITALSELISANLYSLSDNSFVTVRSELRYVELYLYLQHMRFEDRFDYEILLDSQELMECLIPRLSVEPIVENAVVHGIEGSLHRGRVVVSISREGEDLLFQIADNGTGFDVGALAVDPTPSGKGHRIGIRNTDKRLKLMFGEGCGLMLHSAVGAGTIATIRVPVITDRHDKRIGGAL